MATNTKLDSLVINYLTQSQYDSAKNAGTLNANQIYMTPASSGSTYTLPAATGSTLGGVKIGSNITVSSGTISLSKTNVTNALGYTPPTTDTKYTLPTASAWILGGVKIGSNITENFGTISLTKANVTNALGYTPPTTDTKYTLPTGNASTLGGVKLSDSTSSTSSTNGGIAATPAAEAAIAEAKLAAWPIGSIYMSASNTSPASLFGGTWERISDRFLLGASGTYPAGATGGEFAHTLTQSELPDYSLSVTNGSNVIRSKTGNYADAYVQTQSSGWGIPNWECKTVTVASGGSGEAHNNMPPYLAVYMWKRTR